MIGQGKSPTFRVASFAVETALGDVPEVVIDRAKTVVLDTIGVALAAASMPVGRTITDYVRSLGGEPVSGVLGGGFRTSAPLAALANGTLAHGLDYDDHGHLSTHTLPAALAVGELLHAPGRRVLEAYIVGREVGARLSQVVEAQRKAHRGPTYRGWYRVSVVGPLAAAVSAGKLLGLDVSAMASALGIAASSAGGLRRNMGTMTKALHAGNAASDGVRAALLAQRGFTADQEILEAPLGLVNALCLPGESDWTPLDKLGRPFELEAHLGIKRFPACTPSHIPVEALLRLKRRHGLRADDIGVVEADLHPFSLLRPDPSEAIATGYSLPYLLAIALLDGEVGLDQVGDARLRDPEVRELMARVRHDPSAASEDGAERVTVRLRDGRVLSEELAHDPDLSTPDEIERKYRACAGRMLPTEAVERLYQWVMEMERLEDVRAITAAALHPPASRPL